MPAPMRQPAAPMRPVMLLQTRNVHLDIVGRGPDGIRVRAPGRITPRGKVRLRFEPSASHPGVCVLLSEVVSYLIEYEGSGPVTELCLRHRAAFASEGRRCLVDFLTATLRLESIAESGVMHKPAGWFYRFPQAVCEDEVAEAALLEREAASTPSRREARVSVRVPVTYRAADDWERATAYNISPSGLFLLTDAKIPQRGAKVTVFFPVPGAMRQEKVVISGRVMWAAEALEGGRGLGIEIHRVDDGNEGHTWNAYVKGEGDFGGALDVNFT